MVPEEHRGGLDRCNPEPTQGPNRSDRGCPFRSYRSRHRLFSQKDICKAEHGGKRAGCQNYSLIGHAWAAIRGMRAGLFAPCGTILGRAAGFAIRFTANRGVWRLLTLQWEKGRGFPPRPFGILRSAMDQRAASARVAGLGAAFIASGRRRVPRAQGMVTCTSFEAAMTDFIQRRSFFMIVSLNLTCFAWSF